MKKSIQLFALFIFGFYGSLLAAFIICAFLSIPIGGAAQNTPQILAAFSLLAPCCIAFYITLQEFRNK